MPRVDAAPRKLAKSAARAKTGAATSIDDYLATVTADRRGALETLRRTILAIIPKAEECISYRIPAFRLDGRIVAGFSATARGCSYFPFSGSTLRTLAADLSGYGGTKSALHFEPARGLPKTLVRKLIEARLAEGPARRAGAARGHPRAASSSAAGKR